MTRSQFRPFLLLTLALVFAMPPVLANGLYVGEAVLGEGERVDNEALMRALDEVLMRLTGQVDPTPVRVLGVSTAQLNTLILTRQMVQRERQTRAGDIVTERRVRAEFDEQAVNRLLRANDMPRWGRERPAILLWMVVDDEDGVAFADDPWLEAELDEQARRLGLDLVRPLGDALDMAEVTMADVRGGFLDSSRSAAQRYGAGVIVMLDLRREDGGEDGMWAARWFWRVEQVDGGFQHSGQSLETLLARGMERLATNMASRFAVRPTADSVGKRRLVVDGIVDDVHYAEVRNYLEGLSIVETLQVVSARDRRLEFELTLSGGGLEQFLGMGGLLEVDGPAAEDTLFYRLRR